MTPPARGQALGRRRLGAIAVIAFGTIAVAAASFALVRTDRSLGPSPSPGSSRVLPSERPAPPALPASRTFLDAALSGGPSDPLGPTTLHPVWLVDGQWWAALLDPPTGQTRLYRLAEDGAAFGDTGRILDERQGAVVDALVADGHLYVASVVRGRGTGDGVRLTRYSPDPGSGFRPDPDFPVRLTERGVRSMSLARDGRGTLWLATVMDGALRVAHTTANDATWTAPVALEGPGVMADDDSAALVAFGPGRLGILWTSRATNAIHFAWRAEGDAGAPWSSVETVSAGMPLLGDPIAASAGPAGSVVVSIAGDVRGSTSSRDAARLTVARRDAGGTWTATVAGRVQERHGPSALLVGDSGEIDLIATQQTAGSAWVLKRSRPDRLEFEAGSGAPLATPVGVPSVDLGGPHLAAGAWTTSAAVLVVGFDSTLGRYVHTLIGPPPGPTGPSPSPGSSPGPSASPGGGPVAALPQDLVDDTFDPFAPGVVAPNGWAPRDGDRADRLVVAAVAGRGNVLTLRSTTAASARACKSFSPLTGGALTATVLVRLGAMGTADATITSLRLHGTEAALVRFGSGGTFAYYAGATKVRTTVAWKVGTWYRSTVRLDLGHGTYDWELSVDGAKAPLVRAARIPVRDAAATTVDSICVQTSDGRADLGLAVDRVVVTR